MFLCLDGVDGGGKTTQLELLKAWLRAEGHDVVSCRDPGTTPLGEELRKLVLNRHDLVIHRRAEMLVYMAARAQLVEQVIRPALEAGRTVVSDRFLLANVVYQGHAGGLDVDSLWAVGQVAVGGLEPDLVCVLDLPAEVAAARMTRTLDRMEAQGLEFQRRVRAGFLAEAARRPERIAVIDATQTPEEVHGDIVAAIRRGVTLPACPERE